MTAHEMQLAVTMLGITNEELAEKAGVPIKVVEQILLGDRTNVSYIDLRAIQQAIERAQEEDENRVSGAVHYGKPVKKPGEYTIEDYFAWPEEERIELIDGVIYDMSAPVYKHQRIVGDIYFQLRSYVMRNKGKCTVALSPLSVRLDMDNKTMVQPDVMLICDKDKIGEKYIDGAPDMVVEVLSPSTREKDTTIKLRKYTNAGVREYWIVDPMKEYTKVYDIEHESTVEVYPFGTPVPVHIFAEQCTIIIEGSNL